MAGGRQRSRRPTHGAAAPPERRIDCLRSPAEPTSAPQLALPELERPLPGSDHPAGAPPTRGGDRPPERTHASPAAAGGRDPVQLSLAPDAQQIALQVTDQGRWRVELLDLSDLLEPDRPPGQSLSTPALSSEP